MNDSTGRLRGLRWWWRRAALLAMVAGLAVLMAACGSSPSPSPGAYVACMRKHGVTGAFASPPPTSMPTSLPTSLPTSGRGGRGGGVKIPAKVSAAGKACHSLAPRPGRPSGPG